MLLSVEKRGIEQGIWTALCLVWIWISGGSHRGANEIVETAIAIS